MILFDAYEYRRSFACKRWIIKSETGSIEEAGAQTCSDGCIDIHIVDCRRKSALKDALSRVRSIET